MENEKNEMNEVKLDDATRVRVLSPGMLVAKRFFRNKLAIVGLAIIIFMFLFSFVGGWVMPYSQSQIFYTTEEMKKDYAGAAKIEDFRYMTKDDEKLPGDFNSQFILASIQGEPSFTTKDGSTYALEKINDNMFILSKNGVESVIAYKEYFAPYSEDTKLDYEFCKTALVALYGEQTEMTVAGQTYTIEKEEGANALIKDASGADYAFVSDMVINPLTKDFLTPDYIMALREAVDAGQDSFEFTDANGDTENYQIKSKEGQYIITKFRETRVIDTYAKPSAKHLCGTDANGMDLLARLMYGGRISLLIGFVVVIIEVVIGVILGGIAGFFGGWVDNILMRVVDIVYCIPSLPLYLILGSIMDYYKASATVRIYTLCIVMGLIGWVGIARIVRGQILSLREQEFMVAAEATGISTRRRIFRHLVPNVIPQLVVFASMGIGDVILAESTLSFLGLGIKFPAASWGSIINAVNDSFVMTNYLFVWVPAGTLILFTVLAFNFIGDGLRDAFDPKMKR